MAASSGMALFSLFSLFPTATFVAVTHWKLGEDRIPVPVAASTPNDEIFVIVSRSLEFQQRKRVEKTQSRRDGSAAWLKTDNSRMCIGEDVDSRTVVELSQRQAAKATSSRVPLSNGVLDPISTMACLVPAVVTKYDNLAGIQARHQHSSFPEPDVIAIFRQPGKGGDVDIEDVENQFLEIILSGELDEIDYNRLGNYWRVQGGSREAIDCFRQGLSIKPDHPDLLLNLARVLLNFEYWNNSRLLVERCLEVKSPNRNSWLEHYTLGEISKMTGDFGKALLHFKQTLELNPTFELAQSHVNELEELQDSKAVAMHTGIILVLLTAGVILGLLYVLDKDDNDKLPVSKKSKTKF